MHHVVHSFSNFKIISTLIYYYYLSSLLLHAVYIY